ncbi:glycogen synthase, partial [bacterium]|nr:glycogen synthase [bacterium]
MSQKLKVAYVSTEAFPFAKSGELADVASSLPKYLSSLGAEVSLFLPKYRRPQIDSAPKEKVFSDLKVPLGEKRVKARVYRSEQGKYDIYFIDSPKYFWRDHIYGTGKGEYLDNDERFIFYNRAVLEYLLQSGIDVDVLHCNSWPTAMIPVFLKSHYAKKKKFKKVATVFTLHNVTYQGKFPPESLRLAQLNWNYFSSAELALNGKFNFLKAGIEYADMLNTVSSSYRKEILTKKHGFNLEKILQKRKNRLVSIRNGIDYEVWDPQTDPYIAANYSASDLRPKKKCKRDLLEEFGLSLSDKTPVVGLVSYLAPHKGIDILVEAVDDLMKMKVKLVVLGKGDEKYEDSLSQLQKKYPQKMAFKRELNPALAHKVAAGADIFLIPSLYEPCGLNQLYSFRYGTVPVVRSTGGLRETVKPFDRRSRKGNGFLFKEYSSEALVDAVKRAVDCYRKSSLWKKIVETGLQENFSWENSARKYLNLYQKALQIKRGG